MTNREYLNALQEQFTKAFAEFNNITEAISNRTLKGEEATKRLAKAQKKVNKALRDSNTFWSVYASSDMNLDDEIKIEIPEIDIDKLDLPNFDSFELPKD